MPTSDLIKIVAIAAVAFFSSFSLTNAQSVDERTHIPVQIKCPSDNKGVLELVSQNALGGKQKIVIEYKGNAAWQLFIYSAEPNAGWRRFMDWNYATNDILTKQDAERVSPQARSVYEKFAAASAALINKPDRIAFRICRSDGDERKKALGELAANREKLGLR